MGFGALLEEMSILAISAYLDYFPSNLNRLDNEQVQVIYSLEL
jgi:hypothetical protein